jgi:hypothetical protein
MTFTNGFIESRLGAFPSPWDDRRYRVRVPTSAELTEIPDEYDGLESYQTIGDQGDIGSCVGWCGEKVMEITNHLLDLERDDLSAGWLYYRSRHYANIPDWQEGSTNLGLMKALKKEGAATEACVPTDSVSPFDVNPCGDAYDIAKKFAIDSYWMVNREEGDMKAAMWGLTHEAPYKMPDGSLGKIPLVTAYPVNENYYEGMDDGVVPMPGGKFLGGHSSCVAGWKIIDGEGYWINYNSWGVDAGDSGKFYLPFGYPFYDVWIIHNGPLPDPTPSTCVVGNSMARILSMIPSAFGRRGRFQYLNP